MGKVVKYCNSCDEGFAERFVFCPTCGASLQAFEMNPVAAGEVVPEEVAASEPEVPAAAAVPIAAVAANEVVEPEAVEPEISQDLEAGHTDEEDIEINEPEGEDEVPVTVAVPAAAAVFTHAAMSADDVRPMTVSPDALDDGYYITVIEEKNVKQRNMLLLGSAAFCLTIALIAVVISLFEKDLGVGAIDDGKLFSAVIVDEPMTVEEEQQQQKQNKDKSGGGGGGGRKEEETTQGDLANQTKNPERPPQAVPRLENPLPLPQASTQGNRTFEQKYDRYGDPNGKFTNWNNGPGSGGGQGTGVGPGQGSGRGTGAGSGTGSGSGSGSGDDNGPGSGSGGGGEPPPIRAAVTQPYKILAKPRASYTEEARKNNFTGVARIKVTLLGSGQVGSIVPVSRLPYGLTETAIAAARQIKFEPKKVNGVAQSVVVTLEYSFTIY